MSANCVPDTEIVSWVEKTLSNSFVKNYEINITGKSEKGDGYAGEIVFVRVTGISNENKNVEWHLVIKHGKVNDLLRKEQPMKQAFVNEIYIYDTILPFFRQFQSEKNIQNRFDSVAKCYNTLILENMEVLVFDNLKEREYELHDRKKSFNMCHLKTVLAEYGKLHALSFAIRKQRPEEFNKLADFEDDIGLNFVLSESFSELMKDSIEKALDILQERNELYLLEQFRKLLDPVDSFRDLLKQNEPQSVITHGDCWNNNFMFRYQNADKSSPSSVAILDWQLSAVRSPVFDLSYLIYATSGANELDKFEELLKFYHSSFSNFLKDLGCNPEKLFPYSALEAHWKKYALSGFLFGIMILPLILCDKEDAPKFEELKEGQKISDIMCLDIKDKDSYFNRVKPIINHYFEYTCQ